MSNTQTELPCDCRHPGCGICYRHYKFTTPWITKGACAKCHASPYADTDDIYLVTPTRFCKSRVVCVPYCPLLLDMARSTKNATPTSATPRP